MSTSVANISQYSGEAKLGRATPSICESVLPGGVSKAFAPRQDVFYEGDEKRSVYQIEAGAVCLYKMTVDGRRQIFDFAFAGDVIGLGAADVYSCSAQTVGATLLKSVPVSKLHQLASRDPKFALGLYRAISTELEATRDLLLTLGQQNALERVAIFLLTLSQRNERIGRNPRLLTLPMTRSDIADLLGMSTETVSRCFTKLKEQRLIDIIRGSLIQIIDHAGLQTQTRKVNVH
jgi:CRP/FNR family transcriptional regulator